MSFNFIILAGGFSHRFKSNLPKRKGSIVKGARIGLVILTTAWHKGL